VAKVVAGEIALDEREAHHVRDVLRLKEGAFVEVFDDAGVVGRAELRRVTTNAVIVAVNEISAAREAGLQLIIASAVPKAARGDWMVEKLSELGVAEFVPLATERSVALPEGKNKLERWRRLAEAAAKQSHRAGVMRIEQLTPLARALDEARAAGEVWQLSTGEGAVPMREQIARLNGKLLTVFVGPEGGWSVREMELFEQRRIVGVKLTETILRVETTAIAVAAVLGTMGV
jgi:16S rRNA (uracil1498-N3)-methyltransferase